MFFKVTIRDGASYAHVAVEAESAADAEAVVVRANRVPSGATTYPIDPYGVRFCDLVLGSPQHHRGHLAVGVGLG